MTEYNQIPLQILEDVKSDYESKKESVSSLLSKYNLSSGTFYKILKNQKVRLRAKGPKKPYHPPGTRIPKTLHNRLIAIATSPFQSSNHTILKLDDAPRPDALIVDWENKTITAIEAETWGDGTNKISLYKNSRFNKPIDTLIIQTIGDKKIISLQ